jgi:hypothetical protein
MVVMPAIATDLTTSKKVLHSMQRIEALLSLNHREGRLDLPTEPTRGVPKDRNAEAAFAVDKADDPLRESWPFLLIVRIRRIVTAHAGTIRRGCDMGEYR